MRRLVVLGLLAACDKGKAKPAPTPEPPVTRPIDAGTDAGIDAALMDAAQPDASVAAITITRAGVGSLGKLQWWKLDNDAIFERMKSGIPLRGTKVGFDVLELPFVEETEEGYFSIKRGDDELVQVLRTFDEKPASVVVWTNEISTADGIRVGDHVDALVAKHPDLTCNVDMYGTFIGMIAVYVACKSASEPEITYFIDVGKTVLKNGKVSPTKLANLAIVGIGHAFVGS